MTDLKALDAAATLLPCPFCGGEAHVVGNCGQPVEHWMAVCHSCVIELDVGCTTPVEAITAWNTRANQLAPVDAIGEAVEALKMHLRNIGKRASWGEDEDQKQLRINCDKITLHLELAHAALTRLEARNG
jgi:Lar family restriction alleviation protein